MQQQVTNKMNETSQSSSSLFPMVLTCAFHNNQTITNFCINPSCLLPMCPICVSIHSDEHRQQKTHGEFERYFIFHITNSIQQVFNNISTMLLTVNKSLQDLSQQYTQDYWNKQKLLDTCKQILNNHKKKFIKQIDRKFQQIEHKMTRKINEFQDNIHDKYKQLQTEIQYLYQSVNKQRQQLLVSNQRILKNVICFYSQRKQQKMRQWQGKFRNQVNQLKRQSIRVKCSDELYQLVKSIEYFFTVEAFSDDGNQYLVSSARDLLSSNDTKRKRAQSPRWRPATNEDDNILDRGNLYTVRNGNNNIKSMGQNYSYSGGSQDRTMINQLTRQGEGMNYSSGGDYQKQWSAGKI